MKRKLFGGLAALAICTSLSAQYPAAARGFGGFGGMHGFGGGFGGMHGGMGSFGVPHFGGGFGGPHFGGAFMGPHMGFGGGMPGAGAFSGPFIGHPGFHRFAFHPHRGFGHFAFAPFGLGYGLYGYDGCWRQTWTPYGWRWINVCYGYSY
ncbi:MAG: hypothetical protein ACR652_14150 [Methylocystis sp.]|uniref:hypothetical protein n=1 Tax=Methylocystis sp. TaxID=1911079 RepID=UPI003DA6937E